MSPMLERFFAYSPEMRARLLRILNPREADAWDAEWSEWAHGGQVAPAALADGGDWRTWVLLAGRGFGKTRAGAEWVLGLVRPSRCGFETPLRGLLSRSSG